MKFEDLPEDLQEDFTNLKNGSNTIEAEIQEALEVSKSLKEFKESVSDRMRKLIEESEEAIHNIGYGFASIPRLGATYYEVLNKDGYSMGDEKHPMAIFEEQSEAKDHIKFLREQDGNLEKLNICTVKLVRGPIQHTDEPEPEEPRKLPVLDGQELSNIIVVGQCNGVYEHAKVKKEFQAKVLVSARPDGTVIVHNLSDGVRPLCYIDGGAEISLARNMSDCKLEFFATTEDGQQLTIQFTDIVAMQGVPGNEPSNSLAMSVLQCVFDMGGKYGRTTIARVLTGSVSKKVLTINVSKLGTYAVAKDASMKEVLALIDWLIEEKYLAFVEDSEFPVIVVTSKGLGIISGDDLPAPIQEQAEQAKRELPEDKPPTSEVPEDK